MECPAQTLAPKSIHKLLLGSIVPRPIGWISTVDERGVPNLAPYSYFNAVSADPPCLMFSAQLRRGSPKDTLANVQATGEFVVNIVTEKLAEAMNATSAEFPADVDEFQAAGLTAAASVAVRPPRVAESPIHFECRVYQIVPLTDGELGGHLVIGRIVHIHIHDDVLIGDDKIDLAALRPIGRLSGPSYVRINDIFDMTRPTVPTSKTP
ncbi:MAG: flavin reductase family protein [Caldilineales bacterium]|nr:flavin reductase family protein [Caldilineales bacterium]